MKRNPHPLQENLLTVEMIPKEDAHVPKRSCQISFGYSTQKHFLKEDKCDNYHICLKYPASTGENDGTPLQYSCLENPMDGGAW